MGSQRAHIVIPQDLIDEIDAKHAGQLRNQAERKGRTFSLPDMIVAATALEYDLTLMTGNIRDFRVPGLQLYPLSR